MDTSNKVCDSNLQIYNSFQPMRENNGLYTFLTMVKVLLEKFSDAGNSRAE